MKSVGMRLLDRCSDFMDVTDLKLDLIYVETMTTHYKQDWQ